MHHLEDYLESMLCAVETLPADLQHNFMRMRESDLRAQGVVDKVEKKIRLNFGAGRKPANRDALARQVRAEYQKALDASEEKVRLANETAALVQRHKQRLDVEIKKFGIELEAATPGITLQAEQRSLKLDERPPLPAPSIKRGVEDRSGEAHGLVKARRLARESRAASQAPLAPVGELGGVGLMAATINTGDLLAPAEGLEQRYCLCNQVSFGDMVGCDNEDCVREWFHYACVGVTEPPTGKWYCPDCEAAMRRRGLLKA